MKKTRIYALALAVLKNDKHMAVAAFMAEALREYRIADTSLAIFVAAFLSAYDKENQAFMRIDRKALTKKLNEADTNRINALRVLRDALKVITIRPNEEQKALADRVLDVIELYGGAGIYNQPVDSRTGNITNLIEDLEEKLDDAITALNLTSDVQALKAANEFFLQCQKDRDKSDAEFGKKAMADARVETDNAWRAIVDTVNNTIAYGTDEEREVLVPFAKYMNVEIDKYRIQTGQGVGGSISSGSGSDTEEEEGVRMRIATFKFHNGNMVKLRLEVGAPLEALENTLGYKWKPEVDEFMPDKNVTYREVPMTAEEVTATFHFFDHHEEEIRQLVGSLLTAPDNTEGCVWQPAVPETMPAENTVYYEVPATQTEPTKYTITFIHNGETVASYELEEGATVTAPTAPSGYHWVNVPATMPAENLTIHSEEDEEEPPILS